MERELKIGEVQIALKQLSDQVKNVRTNISDWHQVLDENGLYSFNYEFSQIEYLANKLGKDIQELKNKLDYYNNKQIASRKKD